MRKRTRRFLTGLGIAFAASLASASISKAAGPKEFFLNSAGLELFGGASRISLAPGLNYGFYEWLQAGASLSFQTVGFAEESVNTLTFLLGPTFNLGGAYEAATFIFFGLGVRKGSGDIADPEDDPSGTGLVMMVGRRIPLFSGIAYRPSAGLQLAGKTTIVINALAISYFF